MLWQVTLHTDAPIVETVYSGRVSADDLQAAVKETLAVAQRHDRRLFLTDCTALTGGHSVGELYFQAAALANDSHMYTCKAALLTTPVLAVKRLVEFWQTTASTRGLQVQLFDQRDRALAWLLQSTQG